jgi:hypothetical protein
MFELKFATDNAAFDDDEATDEIARILRNLANRIRHPHCEPGSRGFIFDVNGNPIGEWRWSE